MNKQFCLEFLGTCSCECQGIRLAQRVVVMLRCLAGICGGGSDATPDLRANGKHRSPQPEEVQDRQVVKPTVRLDEKESMSVASFEDLVSRLGVVLAPPGAVQPCAVATEDFPRNCTRLLVLLPSLSAPQGVWDAAACSGRGDAIPIFRWAQANGYSACLFSAAALAASPTETWDRVLRGSPAGSVFVLAAAGALPMLAAALAPQHPLLYSRFRLAVAPFESASAWPPAWPADLPAELVEHLAGAVLRAPAAWVEQEPRMALQGLFELLALRETRWQKSEARKYAGFQTLKENDMPGLKRMGVEQRIQRLDRDRANDELAQLLRKNEKVDDSGDEPGVD
mmetsp:Transcript_34082/g.89853  ORF Transcript_34082/g.89853 Transcript_34082/m.89853 type:complete len:339 (+) Transcript_34082:3-1019(+)